MKFKNLTKKVMMAIVIAIILILIYDAYAISQGGTEASISSAIIVLSYKQPLVPFSIGLFSGILFGHLFWRMRPNKDTISQGIDILKNEKGHGYPGTKDWLKVLAVLLTAPISIPILLIKEKIKKNKESK